MEDNKLSIISNEFDGKEVRSVWDNKKEEWYFSIEDIVQILTDSVDAKQYIKKLKSRDKELNINWGTVCTLVDMKAKDGKKRKVSAANTKGVLRIIQSIPSKKAEPFKMWLAKVGSERIDETVDPEIAINRALETYRRKGYSDDWINQRLKSIDIRKEFTDEMKRVGVRRSIDFAFLTNLLTKTWSGYDVKEYKELKGLKKENLRDNMTNMELVLNMLAETSSTEISKSTEEVGIASAKDSVTKGGNIAKNAREQLEKETGKKIISSKNFKEREKLGE